MMLDTHQGVKIKRFHQIDKREFVVVNLAVAAAAASGRLGGRDREVRSASL